MVDVGVLQCPKCEQMCLYRMGRIDDSDTRKELASVHLQTHRLEESKYGIYRVMMADRFEQVEISDTPDVSLGKWQAAAEIPSALPEDVRPISVPLSRQ